MKKQGFFDWLFSREDYYEHVPQCTVGQEAMQTYLKCHRLIESLSTPLQIECADNYIRLFMSKYHDYDKYDELSEKLMKKEFDLILNYDRSAPSFSPKY